MCKTPIEITDGWLAGHMIRRRRKPTTCDYWRGRANGGTCGRKIAAGDLYVEGELSQHTDNPWACEVYCLECAGPEARAAVEQRCRAT